MHAYMVCVYIILAKHVYLSTCGGCEHQLNDDVSVCKCVGVHIKFMYSGTCVLWTPWDQPKACPDYQGVLIFQVNLYDKAPFGTIAI